MRYIYKDFQRILFRRFLFTVKSLKDYLHVIFKIISPNERIHLIFEQQFRFTLSRRTVNKYVKMLFQYSVHEYESLLKHLVI